MTEPFIITKSTRYDQCIADKVELRSIDDQDLFEFIFAYGIEPVYSEGDDRQIRAYFVASEAQKFLDIYFSNGDVLIPLQRLIYAKRVWKHYVTIWKSKKYVTNGSE